MSDNATIVIMVCAYLAYLVLNKFAGRSKETD
jgi:hypothetical protein